MTVSPFEVRVGDCFDDPEVDDDGFVTDVRLRACDEPHDNEAFFVFDLEGDAFPGTKEVETTSNERCVAAFEGYVGIPFDDSELNAGAMFFPDKISWEDGDREVLCSLWHGDFEKLTETMQAARR